MLPWCNFCAALLDSWSTVIDLRGAIPQGAASCRFLALKENILDPIILLEKTMRKVRSFLIGATILGTGLVPVAAFAQDAPATEEVTSDEDLGNEIIVTASKRAQTLQDTPIAVSVTSAADIERSQVRDLLDIQTLVPSLRVGQLQSSANTNFIIRGFGNGANNAGIEPSVGVFIDGVYRSRSAAQIGDLPNVQRVEVLRGPQSTLFGKNASAGIISVVTAEPQFDFGGSAELSYGNFNAIIAKADITGPISDKLAFSLSGGMNKRDGYVQGPGDRQQVERARPLGCARPVAAGSQR
jgi:iron complex outermembrane recepter protein